MTVNTPPSRNSPCPCGSGKRYKACCGALVTGPSATATPAVAAEPSQTDVDALIALYQAGRYEVLETEARGRLEHQPDHPLVLRLLAAALSQQGKDALETWRRLSDLSPTDAEAHNNLGNGLARLGRFEEAAARYRLALAVNTQIGATHHNLANTLLELGQFEAALDSAQHAVALQPGHAESHNTLGGALLELGRLDEAAASFRQAIALTPRWAEPHANLANVLQDQGQLDAAVTAYDRALSLDPNFVEVLVNRGNALRAQGGLAQAVASYQRAIQARPTFAEAFAALGATLRLQGETTSAREACQSALALKPDLASAMTTLGESYADHGQFAQAETLFRQAIKVDPEAPEAWSSLARIRKMTTADADWLAQAERIAAKPMPARRALYLHYAIAKYFDDVGAYDQAFAHFQRANALTEQGRAPHDREAVTRAVDQIIQAYDQSWFERMRGAGDSSERPVFIVGMLRSGTSLTEQILASHPHVHGAGELAYWGTEAARRQAPSLTSAGASTAVAELARDYRDQLARLSQDARRVVDKMPTNFMHLGLIHAVFPRARILHMRRDPIDTCLSIYFQHFESSLSYANDLDDLAHFYRQYHRLMRHWRQTLPPDVLMDVPYEGLVADQEAWSRRLVDFIGLDWDPACLAFERTERNVITASKWQVRQKITRASVERWRHYKAFVGPLLSLAALKV